MCTRVFCASWSILYISNDARPRETDDARFSSKMLLKTNLMPELNKQNLEARVVFKLLLSLMEKTINLKDLRENLARI